MDFSKDFKLEEENNLLYLTMSYRDCFDEKNNKLDDCAIDRLLLSKELFIALKVNIQRIIELECGVSDKITEIPLTENMKMMIIGQGLVAITTRKPTKLGENTLVEMNCWESLLVLKREHLQSLSANMESIGRLIEHHENKCVGVEKKRKQTN
jgi:hypothetical protein